MDGRWWAFSARTLLMVMLLALTQVRASTMVMATPELRGLHHALQAPRLHAVAIGDSVMLGAESALSQRGIVVYAVKNRAFIQGIDVAESLRADGILPRAVVVHLGANGPISNALFDEMMRALQGVPRVVFLTVKVPGWWESEVNAALRAGVKRWRNARLVDWHAMTLKHPGWLWSDGLHLTPIGAFRYAQIIAWAVRR